MKYTALDCVQFSEALASKAAVPGGGGVSALVAALGVALASMVTNLTIGKKKFASFATDHEMILEKAAVLRTRLLELVDEDAAVFTPLSQAYAIPKEDPTRAEVMENALKLAVSVPAELVRLCGSAIELHQLLVDKSSALVISDVGVGVALCKAALQGAVLNVYINTKSMQDREYAQKLNFEADSALVHYGMIADQVYQRVVESVKA